MSGATWRTRDGEEVAVRDLEDSHLKNVAWLLQRRAAAYKVALWFDTMGYSESAPDGAAMAAESEAEALDEMDPHEVALMTWPVYGEVVREAERRGLDLVNVQNDRRCRAIELRAGLEAIRQKRPTPR